MLWTQDYAHQWFDICRNKQLVGWMTPPVQLATSLSKPLATCCISWIQRSHLSGPPSQSESSTPLVFPRLFAGSGVGDGWLAVGPKIVVTEKTLFHLKTTVFGYACGRSRVKKPLVRSVVAWLDPGLEPSCPTTAPSSAVWLPARAAMSKGSRLSKEKGAQVNSP